MTIVECWDNQKGRRKEKAAAVRAAFPALRHIKSDQGIWWRVDQARNPAPLPSLPPEHMAELKIPYQDSIIISDAQIPLMDASLLEKAALLCKVRGIKQVIWAGDNLDLASLGQYAEKDDASLQEGLKKMAQAYDMFAGCEHVVLIGNHDNRLQRGLGGQLLHADIMAMVMRHCKEEHRYKVCERYYIIMEAGPHSEHPFRISHQKPYSRIRGKVAYTLAAKYQAHYFSAHQHHLGLCRDISDRFWCVDLGTFQESEITKYIYDRDTSNPIWNKGFVTIEDGMPHLFYNSAPEEWWRKQLEG